MSDMTSPPTPESDLPADPTTNTAAGRPPRPLVPAWSSLDPGIRIVAAGGLAAAIVVNLGGILNVWSGNTNFLLLATLAAGVAAITAWGSARPRVQGRIPIDVSGEIVSTLSSGVVAVLGIWRLIEVLFDFDDLSDYGGVIGLLLTAALAALGVAMTWYAFRRDHATTSAIRSTDRSVRLALGGLALVLFGWGVMLASYWTMHAAAVTLALITLSALIVVLSGRGLPAISAWAGVAGALLVVLLAINQWGELARFSEGRFDIGVSDLLPFLVYVVGIMLVIAGGALTGMAAMPRTPASPAAPPPAPPSSAG